MYLIDLGMFYQPKNKLCKAVQEFISKQQRKVFSDNRLKDYENYLEMNIKDLNKQFPKCTPVTINFWSPDGKDRNFQIESVVSLTMQHFINEEYKFK